MNPRLRDTPRFENYVKMSPRPSVIIIALGTNDIDVFARRWRAKQNCAPEIQREAIGLMELLRQLDPLVPIVVLSPLCAKIDSARTTVSQALACAASQDRNSTFIATEGWVLEFASDKKHLTPRGHCQLANQLLHTVGMALRCGALASRSG